MAEEYNGAVNHFEVIGSDDAALLLAKNRSWAEGAPSRAEAAMRAVAQADGGTGSNRQRNAIAQCHSDNEARKYIDLADYRQNGLRAPFSRYVQTNFAENPS